MLGTISLCVCVACMCLIFSLLFIEIVDDCGAVNWVLRKIENLRNINMSI